MNSDKISIEALAARDDFQKYCLAPEPEDILYWEYWLDQNPQQNDNFKAAKEAVLNFSLQVPTEEIQSELKIFKDNISTSHNPLSYKKRSTRLVWINRVAAVFLILILALGIWKIYPTEHIQLLTTDFGEMETLELADGSTVQLNANSSIRFSDNIDSKKIREVWLDGEAFFEVKHAARQPFIVHTPKGDIEVLGTAFNVLQRAEDLNVTLVRGKVQLELPNATKINLQPNDQVRINKQTIDHIQVDVEVATAWKNNKMIFRNASIEQIIKRLENDFGWKVELKNSEILKRKINATVPENNPNVLLEALSALYDLKIKKIGEGSYVIE